LISFARSWLGIFQPGTFNPAWAGNRSTLEHVLHKALSGANAQPDKSLSYLSDRFNNLVFARYEGLLEWC
jgi:hypothetical protein